LANNFLPAKRFSKSASC